MNIYVYNIQYICTECDTTLIPKMLKNLTECDHLLILLKDNIFHI